MLFQRPSKADAHCLQNKQMTVKEIGDAAAAGTLNEDQAMVELVKLGFDREDAREQIFIAMGGDDVQE